MPKKIGHKMTLDELAVMVARGFSDMSQRIEGMQRHLTDHDQRFMRLEQISDDILNRLNNVTYRFEFQDLKHRVTRLEKKAGVV